jgi:hypothetical protein
VLENGCCRRRKDSEIHKLNDEYDVVKCIKLGRLRWTGHLTRVEERDPARKVLFTRPGGTGDRKRNRPKLRWCDELAEDVARVG